MKIGKRSRNVEIRNWKFGDGSTRCDISEIFMECAKRFEPMENPAQCIRQYPVGAGPRACPDNMQPQGKGQPQGVCPTLFENELHHIREYIINNPDKWELD